MVWNLCYSSATGETKIAITDTKLYVAVVTLSNDDNVKLFKQLESGFKRKISGIKLSVQINRARTK